MNEIPLFTPKDEKPVLPGGLSRRRLLQLTGLGVTGAVAAPILGALPASAHGTIASHSEIADARTYYEVNGAASSFGYNPTFYARMETFVNFWFQNTPVSWQKPLRIWSYGAHYDGRVTEAHNAGRGFDLSRIYATVNGSLTKVFNARYDTWSAADKAGDTATRRRYWATSAAAHYHFRNVLTYAYNSEHHNHIHIDNLVSGTGNSKLDTSSEAQVKHIQASCSFVWGYATAVDGVWGSQTNTNSRRVLARIGRSGGLTTSQTNWLEFNKATLRKGTGREAY